MLGDVPFPPGSRTPTCGCSSRCSPSGYAVAINRLGPRLAPAGTRRSSRASRSRRSRPALLALWVASDWPIHDLAERYLFSVHMVQHVVYSIIAAPLLLIGTPTWLARWLLSPRWLLRVGALAGAAHPGHDPVQPRGDRHAHAGRGERGAASTRSLHFAVHTLIFVSSLIVWMPLLSPLPEVPRLAAARADAVPVPAVGRADGARVVPHVRRPPAVLVLRPRPAPVAASRPRRHAIAGLIMKIGVGLQRSG